MTSRPVGRSSVVLQSSAINWPSDLASAKARRVASGDTALVEIAFDASAGQSYTFTQIVRVDVRMNKAAVFKGPQNGIADTRASPRERGGMGQTLADRYRNRR